MKYGFSLVDSDPEAIPKQVMDNHSSAKQLKHGVEKRLLEEIEDGNYIKMDADKVKLISPLAAIPKSDGDVRVIHDLSHSIEGNNSLNSHANKEECKYEELQDTITNLQPGMWMAKCDLRWAYRSIAISPQQYTLTGIQWHFEGDKQPTTLVDTTLCFGARKSPAHFNRITKAIKRMMVRRGYNCSVFLDDFLLYEDCFSKCAESLRTLIALLRSLGFRINWKKVCDPCQKIVFLGIEIATGENKLSLDPDKATQLLQDLSELSHKQRISKKQLQRIAGRLNWASNVHTWGRAYLGSFFQGIRKLNKSGHKMVVTAAMRDDLSWWQSCLQLRQHHRAIWPEPSQAIAMSTDSSQVSGGAFLHATGDFLYTNWALDCPVLANEHINVLELAMVREGLKRYAPQFPGSHFCVQVDNYTAIHHINKGYAKGVTATKILQEIATIAHHNNITVSCHHIPGINNEIPDAISRLHTPGQLHRLSSLLSIWYGEVGHPTYFLPNHASLASCLYLRPQVLKLYHNMERAHSR